MTPQSDPLSQVSDKWNFIYIIDESQPSSIYPIHTSNQTIRSINQTIPLYHHIPFQTALGRWGGKNTLKTDLQYTRSQNLAIQSRRRVDK